MNDLSKNVLEEQAEDLSFLDLAIVLAKHKKIVLGLPIAAATLSLIVALLLPPIYTATARILPPQQKESTAAAMLGVLSGHVASPAASIGQALGLRNPNELYAAILKGPTIANRLIERFDLKTLYGATSMVEAREALEETSRIYAGKDGLIAIEVDDEDPERAAIIANAYVEELDSLMQGLALTEAAQRRLFFERQLAKAQDQLVIAEAELRHSIETKGITGVDAQTRAVVGTAEQLRAQIAVKEIQLQAMHTYATAQNPDAVRLRQEIASMRSELGKLEGGRPETEQSMSPSGLANIRKLREVKFLEFTVELLTKQYEIAKIDEAKDAVLIQVVDKAFPPDYKSKPKRAVIVVLATIVASVLGVLVAFMANFLERSRLDPRSAKQLELLRAHLSRR